MCICVHFFDHTLLRGKAGYSERELMFHYRKFYEDVVVMFKCIGPVVMVKCCRNRGPHLRGNFYVQYSEAKFAKEAVELLSGSCYEGKRVDVSLSTVTSWEAGLCNEDRYLFVFLLGSLMRTISNSYLTTP